MNYSINGYKDTSEDRNNSHNIIPGSRITMSGVSKPLTLVPIVNGVPQYDLKRVANPGDPDIDFGEGVEGVLELPFAQMRYGLIGNGTPQNPQLQGGYYDPYEYLKTPFNPNSYKPYGEQGAINNIAPLPSFTGETTLPSPQNSQQQAIDAVAPINTLPNVSNIYPEKATFDPTKYNGPTTVNVQKDTPFQTPGNQYGGWDMNSSAQALGAFINYKPGEGQGGTKALGILGSAGKLGFELARNIAGGAAGMKRYQESEREKLENVQDEEMRNRRRYMQRGGDVYKMATLNYIQGNDYHPSPNVEVESGEYLQTPDGQTMEVLGKRHSDGGELLSMPEGTKVISDYLKIGSKLARYFKKEYKLNVTAGSKFATVMDQYKRKIGLTELLDEEEKILKKLKTQEGVENEGTRNLNLELLRDKYNDLLPEKEELEQKFQIFTNMVFDKQEQTKEEGGHNFKKKVGGNIEEQEMQPGDQQEQPSEIEQLILMFAQLTQQDPAQIIGQLQNMPEEQLEQVLQEMATVVQEQTQPQEHQPEQPPMEDPEPQMRRGGGLSSTRRLVKQDGGEIIEVEGKKWRVYQDPNDVNNSRMVPVEADDIQIPDTPGMKGYVSPYTTGNYLDEEYTSEYQKNLKQELLTRAESTPIKTSNMSKEDVVKMQTVLRDAGYDLGKYGKEKDGVDGKIGKKTQDAMREMRTNDPVTYAQYINAEITPISTPTKRGKITAKPASKLSTLPNSMRTARVNESAPQSSPEPQVTATVESSQPVPTTRKVSPAQALKEQGGKGGIESLVSQATRDIYYDGNRNVVMYRNKAMTPYQFQQLVKKQGSNVNAIMNGQSYGRVMDLIKFFNGKGDVSYKDLHRAIDSGYYRKDVRQEGGIIQNAEYMEDGGQTAGTPSTPEETALNSLIQALNVKLDPANPKDVSWYEGLLSSIRHGEIGTKLYDLLRQKSSDPKLQKMDYDTFRKSNYMRNVLGGNDPIMTTIEKYNPDGYRKYAKEYGLESEEPASKSTKETEPKKDVVKTGNPSKRGYFTLSRSDAANFANKPLKEIFSDTQFGEAPSLEWLEKQMTDPDYTYEDKQRIAERFKDLAAQSGLEVGDLDLTTQEGLNKLASKVQQYDRENNPELARDYSRKIWMTRSGLTKAVSDPGYMEALKKRSPETYKALQKSLEPDGTVKRGSYDRFSKDQKQELMGALDDTSPEFQQSFTDSNYFDNEAYFRGINKNTVVFDNREEYDKWIKNNESRKIDGSKYYGTDKTGSYLRPILVQDRKFSSAEERDAYAKDRSVYNDTLLEDEDGIYINPLIEAQAEETPVAEIKALDNNADPGSSPFPTLLPQYNRIRPNLLQPGHREVGHVQSTAIAVSPEDNIQELNRQYRGSVDSLTQNNPYTAGAFAASAQAETNNAINKAYSTAQMMNAQDQRQVEDVNENRIQQRELTNTSRKDIYEDKANQALDNYVKSWRNYFDVQNQQNKNNWDTTNEINMFKAINQDMDITPFGSIVQKGNPEFDVKQNAATTADSKYYYDPRTKTMKLMTPEQAAAVKMAGKQREGGLLKGSIKRFFK